MNSAELHADLVQHLSRTLGLEPAQAARVLDEVCVYFADTPERYVQRRHQELQRDGVGNAEAFRRIAAELALTRFRAAPRSERQIRRLIYG